MHKTRLTQNNKQNTPVIQNKNMRKEGGGGERERERISDRITWSPFPSTPWKNLSVLQTLDPMVRGKN